MNRIKTSTRILSFIAIGTLLMFAGSCKKDTGSTTTPVTLPSITTSGISRLTQVSAACGGDITSDGGGTITVSGICWCTSGTPTTSSSKTTNGSSSGSFTSYLTGLSASTRYYVCAYCTNSAGTAYGSVISFITKASGTVYDIDGNAYDTISIGSQVWMMSNFKATHYRNGTAIPYSTSSLSTGAYCYYATYDTAKYGMLYNYYAVIDVDSLAPTGWHVATNADYTKLVNSQGGASTAGGHLKEAGTADWTYPNTGADNSSGFTALPGGYYGGSDIAQAGNFWSSTASGSNAFYLYLFYGSAASQQNTGLKTLYLSVRCVKN